MNKYEIKYADIDVILEEHFERENITVLITFEGKTFKVNGVMAYDRLRTHEQNKGYFFNINQFEEEYNPEEWQLGIVLNILNDHYQGEEKEFFVDWV